ncbi:hypothetical protein ACWDCZ_41715, partial [Kitasatospora sp. NPDC001225]
MTRAAVPGLPSPHPIGELLPALFAEDDFAQRFTAGLDTVLAPVFATLDNLPAYFQPGLAPADFLDWLAERGIGEGTVNYRLRDWLFSRQ